MVRIGLPNRLKSYTGSASGSRNSSPTPGNRRPLNMDNGPASAKPSGLMLKMVIMKGRNLAPKDKNGTSDPYLVVTLGDSKNTTPAIPKTLDPEWNMICEMPINGIDSLLLDCVCWDKDKFGKDYMGEFDLAVEEIFTGEQNEKEPTWYPLKNKRKGGKNGNVSGDIQLQFTLYDALRLDATSKQVMEKFWAVSGVDPEAILPIRSINSWNSTQDGDDDDDADEDEEPSDEADDMSKPGAIEKKRRNLRIKGLKKKKKQQSSYEFNGGSDVVGIIFLEIGKITDLPPERNMTRTSFDMDAFVVASVGKKTYRTRVIRHNLNPVYNEKMIFQVLRHEQQYSIAFTVIDRDKLSGNDFIASTTIPLQDVTRTAPKADPETGLYDLKEPPEAPLQQSKSRFKLPMSRSSSSQSLSKMGRPTMTSKNSTQQMPQTETLPAPMANTSASGGLHQGDPVPPANAMDQGDGFDDRSDPEMYPFNIPLTLKNKEKWEEKHSPELFIKAKYVPYPALRQQFWRAMLKQYDSDESGAISKVELTTMLDTLGSTLKSSTIDGFFKRFAKTDGANDEPATDLTIDQAVVCLEDETFAERKHQSMGDKLKSYMPDAETMKSYLPQHLSSPTTQQTPSSSSLTEGTSSAASTTETPQPSRSEATTEATHVEPLHSPGEEGDYLDRDDLNDKGEEHVVVIRECPICHQPRLDKRSDSDIITHIATCASHDWRQVNNIVMAGFVTPSQAQRKWYSKIITKISYGGYKLGANSANILVQDRITGQINEERMSVYVRLGIRLLYKGLKSREMEKKRIRKLLRGLSFKQGVKYDDPASRSEIQKFIAFHQLDMTEVLLPVDAFRNFNEFFYRQLKPAARPCSAPDNSRIIVSPADCRSVVFNRMDDATRVWVKGREFGMARLLGGAYPADAPRYANGALGIFRLAPQDYHRFHVPVDGVLGTPRTVEGEYYTVNPMAIRSALDVYGENVRVCVPVDSPAHGRVMIVCVGAMMVGSTVITRKPGEEVKRAEELGYFKFGGSTILLLFEEGMMKFDDDLVDNSNGALETLLRVGMSIGHHPQQKQHTPDMRKNDADITESEKAEAKRRIDGSLAPGRDTTNTSSGSMKPPTASMAG